VYAIVLEKLDDAQPAVGMGDWKQQQEHTPPSLEFNKDAE
jgi:hypothetical protein